MLYLSADRDEFASPAKNFPAVRRKVDLSLSAFSEYRISQAAIACFCSKSAQAGSPLMKLSLEIVNLNRMLGFTPKTTATWITFWKSSTGKDALSARTAIAAELQRRSQTTAVQDSNAHSPPKLGGDALAQRGLGPSVQKSARSALLINIRVAHRLKISASRGSIRWLRSFEQATPALRACPSLLRRGIAPNQV